MEKSNINKHIGNKFQEYRLKNNLTQNQVSELTGLEPRHISQIERAEGFNSIGLSDASFHFCQIPLCYFFK